MKRLALVTLVLFPLAVVPAAAQVAVPVTPQAVRPKSPAPGTPEMGDFGDQLFPPELVMQHQSELGLTAEQRTAITQAIKDLQSKVVDFQWQMQDESQKLNEMLRKPSIDETAALAQIDRVLDGERSVKKAHMAALIRIKNTLTAQQKETLSRLRPYMRTPEPSRDFRLPGQLDIPPIERR